MDYSIDLQREIRNSLTSHTPEVLLVDHVHDPKMWMAPVVPNLHDHLKAHQFKFERNQAGVVHMFYKEWSSDQFWLPNTGLLIEAFVKRCSDMERTFPAIIKLPTASLLPAKVFLHNNRVNTKPRTCTMFLIITLFMLGL